MSGRAPRLVRTHASWIVILFAATPWLGCSEGSSVAVSPTTQPARVSVHEWGLVAYHYRQGATDMAEIVAGGARYAHAPVLGHHGLGASGGKPVIYVHTDAETRLSVHLRAPGGTIVEHLPAASRVTPDTIEWNGLIASPTTCPTSTRVTPGDRACATVDAYCEALENPEYDSTDAACLTSASGARDNHLFYRAGVRVGGLPLVVTQLDPDNPGWNARNTGSSPISGKLVVVWRLGGDTPPKVALVDPPSPGATIALPIDGPDLTRAASTTLLRRMLVEAGLTSHETQAFLRAWDTSIFGYIEHPGDLPPHQTPPRALRQTPIALYYLAPRESLERTLPLEITPAPAELVRAMLVKIDLFDPPVGTIGLGMLGTIGMGPSVRGPSSIRFGTAEVSTGLSRELVRRVVQRHMSELRYCAETHATNAPGGRITISFDIGPSGSTRQVAEAANTLPGSEAISRCIVGAVARWAFPAPEGGATVHVVYPFVIGTD